MFADLLERIGTELDRRDIPYMIIGGQAVLAYGEPRLTRDIDLTLGVDSDQVDKIVAVALALDCKVLVDQPREFVQKTMVLPCQDLKSGIRIDFIFSFSPYESEALKRVKRLKIGQSDICFAAVEDLIIHKIVAGRPRDLEDVKNVLIKNRDLDETYLKRWLKEFEEALQRPLLKQLEQLRMQP